MFILFRLFRTLVFLVLILVVLGVIGFVLGRPFVERLAARSIEDRVGTPVRALQQSSGMSQVIILDAMWRWGAKTPARMSSVNPLCAGNTTSPLRVPCNWAVSMGAAPVSQ